MGNKDTFKRIKYKVYLKDGSFVVIWFSGNQLERICKDYGIKYEEKNYD